MLFVARYEIAGLVAHGRNKKGRTAPFGVVRPCCDSFFVSALSVRWR
jgi:hypothetical protein